MSKSYFIPTADHDFLVWLDHFVGSVSPELGLSESDVNALKAINEAYHAKTVTANNASALAKQAITDKNDCRQQAENLIRTVARRIKAGEGYSLSLGRQLGIEGAEVKSSLDDQAPVLSAVDKTGGTVLLSFNKYRSEGVNLYCQRENDSDWVLLGRATLSPFIDNRPLLLAGKPELRRYSAVFMQRDKEVGNFSAEEVITCAP
jgi:hypothetical protein